MDMPPDKRILYLVLLAVAVAIAWWVSGLVFADKSEPFVSLESCFIKAPNIPYIPEVRVYGIIGCLINCESGGDPNAWNKDDPNGGSKGILQFQEQTFYQYAEEAKIQNPDIWNAEQQVVVADYMISRGLEYHWTCNKLCQ